MGLEKNLRTIATEPAGELHWWQLCYWLDMHMYVLSNTSMTTAKEELRRAIYKQPRITLRLNDSFGQSLYYKQSHDTDVGTLFW